MNLFIYLFIYWFILSFFSSSSFLSLLAGPLKVGDAPETRWAAASVVHGTKLYMLGGVDSAGLDLKTMLIFDAETETWSTGPSLRHTRSFAAAAALGDYIYCIGGMTDDDGTLSSVERIKVPVQPGSEWEELHETPLKLQGLSAAAVPSLGVILAIGGFADDDRESSAVLAYTVETGTWATWEPFR